MSDTRMTRGGSGSHWQGCEASHWDCKIKRLEDTLAQVRADRDAIAAELRSKDAEIERLQAIEKAANEYLDVLDNSEDEASTSELREALTPAEGAE